MTFLWFLYGGGIGCAFGWFRGFRAAERQALRAIDEYEVKP